MAVNVSRGAISLSSFHAKRTGPPFAPGKKDIGSPFSLALWLQGAESCGGGGMSLLLLLLLFDRLNVRTVPYPMSGLIVPFHTSNTVDVSRERTNYSNINANPRKYDQRDASILYAPP